MFLFFVYKKLYTLKIVRTVSRMHPQQNKKGVLDPFFYKRKSPKVQRQNQPAAGYLPVLRNKLHASPSSVKRWGGCGPLSVSRRIQGQAAASWVHVVWVIGREKSPVNRRAPGVAGEMSA